MILLSLPIKC